MTDRFRTPPLRALAAIAAYAALAVLAVLAGAPGAGAVVIRTPSGKVVGIALRSAGALTPAIKAQRVSPITAPTSPGPASRTGASRDAAIPPGAYKVGFGGALTDTAPYPVDADHGNADGCNVTQTGVSSDPIYTQCLTDAQVQTELLALIAAHGLPGDTNAIYFVHLPPGVDECDGPGAESASNQCADTDFCAYHSATGNSGPLYGVIPYAHVSGCGTSESPNGGNPADDTISVLSHEHIETITDPFGTGWITAQGDEIGDLCASPGVYGSPLGGGAGAQWNQVINGNHYFLQDEYADSNGSNPIFDSCQQRPGASADGVSSPADPGPLAYQGGDVLTAPHTTFDVYWDPGATFSAAYKSLIDRFLTDLADESALGNRANKNVYDVGAQYGTTHPTAAFTAPSSARAGQAVTFDASSTTDPTPGQTPMYSWNFGDGSTASTTQPKITHTYTATGNHIVTLQVSDQFGSASQPARHSIHIQVPPAAAFTAPTAPLPVGQAAAFDASASNGPDAPITSYAWSFGDGASAAGAQSTHAYTNPGTYTITLTVTDANSNTASATHQVTVVAPGAGPGQTSRASATAGAEIARSGSGRAVLQHGRVVVLLGRTTRCLSGSCTTTVKLTTRVAHRAAHRRTLRTVTIGTVTVNTQAGASSALSVALNSRGRSLLRRLRRLSVTAKLRAASTASATATLTLTFRIAQPARRRH